MAIHNKTYQPVQYLTVKSAEALPACRFVAFDGTVAGDAEKALGVTEIEWLADEYASVVSIGTAVVETDGTISTGDDITSDADGKARAAVAGEAVNGRALEDAASAGYVKIMLVS